MILIIGGLGFIGSALARNLVEQGAEVLLTRRRTSRIPAFLTDYIDNKIRVVDCDILDLPNLIAVFKRYPVESIVHTAMFTLANGSLYQMVKTDLEGTVNVLEAARLANIKRITFTSSNTVHKGIRGDVPCNEAMAIPLDVKHPIGSIKIAGEALCHLYADQYGLEVIVIRPSQIYGPYSASTFTPLELMVEGAVRGRKVVLANVHADEKKDFLYIDDCARAIGMLHLAQEPKHRVYNIASGRSNTCGEAAELVRKLVPHCQIELQGKRAPSYPAGVDISRLQGEFGYQPNVGLEEGLQKYINWVAGEKGGR